MVVVVVFHNTDTHIYILSLTFALLIHNNNKKRYFYSAANKRRKYADRLTNFVYFGILV
jgi:hypothetical protein